MKEFIETISKQEIRENPKLQERIVALLKSLNGINAKVTESPREITLNPSGVLKFLDKRKLN